MLSHTQLLQLQKDRQKERMDLPKHKVPRDLCRNGILVRLQQAQQALTETKKEEKEIMKAASDVLTKSDIVSKADYDSIRIKEIAHTRKENENLHQQNSSKLTLSIADTKGSLIFNRIIIGAGVAATLLYPEIPPTVCKSNRHHPRLPGVIVLDDHISPNTWLKEGKRLMGQPAAIQTPPIFSSKSDDFCATVGSTLENPYEYVVASDFKAALLTTQNEFEMPITHLRAIRIESREEKHSQPWEHKDEKHRVVVQDINAQEKYLYTSAVDICTGLGNVKKLTQEQIDPVLASTLLAENKLIYGCNGDKKLKGDVVFYGGSAVNASWIAEIILLGAQPQAHVKHLVSPNVAPLKDIPTVLNRLIEDACPLIKTALGVIKEVKQLPSQQLAIAFQAPNSFSHEFSCFEDKTIVCDQLVVSRGQELLPLVKDLSDFEICYDESKKIPLGTHSKDGSIATWGAAGTLGIGLKATERAEMIKLVAQHANTTLVENNAMGGISRSSWTIPSMVKRLGEQGIFPVSETHQPHEFEIPRINQATAYEIAQFFKEADTMLTEEDCMRFATAIITERLRKIPYSSEPTGIHSIERLNSILPPHLLMAVANRYFPTLKIKTKKKEAIYKPLSWLNAERLTADADVFISEASVDATVESAFAVPSFSLGTVAE